MRSIIFFPPPPGEEEAAEAAEEASSLLTSTRLEALTASASSTLPTLFLEGVASELSLEVLPAVAECLPLSASSMADLFLAADMGVPPPPPPPCLAEKDLWYLGCLGVSLLLWLELLLCVRKSGQKGSLLGWRQLCGQQGRPAA